MVFKRRTPRSYWQVLTESVWPRGGWTRAFHYVKHRIRRLPDHPDRIARGLAVGVFVSFTPLFGLHFVLAALLARLLRGNVLAALLGTFFGNPLTFPLIAYSSMKIGRLMLGNVFDESEHATLFDRFVGAGQDLKHNFLAIFTDDTMQWGNLGHFFADVFLPYLVGGLIPGLVAAVISFYASEPLIAAYQKHRRKRLKERFEKLKQRLQNQAQERRG